MFPTAKKNIIVVSEETKKNLSSYLRDLMSSTSIKDSTIDVAVWTDIHYLANSPTLSSSQKIIFIGESKKIKSDVESLKNFKKIFDQFGIEIYATGNRAVILVEDRATTQEEYESMLDFCTNSSHRTGERVLEKNEESEAVHKALDFAKNNKLADEKIIEKIEESNVLQKAFDFVKKNKIAVATSIFSLPIGVTIAVGTNLAKNLSDKNKIIEQKYNIALQIFCYEFLNDFARD